MKNLVIVGSGIKAISQITKETEIQLIKADMVFYLLNEPVLIEWINKITKNNFDLSDIYFSKKERSQAYLFISEYILTSLSKYNNVCFVVYGHPTLLSDSVQHINSNIGNNKNIKVTIFPAISSFDCLIADLKIDPGMGCISIDASNFVETNKIIDTTNHVILWQIGMIGDNKTMPFKNNINKLSEKLKKIYNNEHKVVLYEASLYPHIKSKIINSTIGCLNKDSISRLTTAYIPPLSV